MKVLYLVTFLVSFCLIAGSAFAMMYANLQSINEDMNRPKRRRHPEAPEPGEEIMYVDLTREKLEDLYNEQWVQIHIMNQTVKATFHCGFISQVSELYFSHL